MCLGAITYDLLEHVSEFALDATSGYITIHSALQSVNNYLLVCYASDNGSPNLLSELVPFYVQLCNVCNLSIWPRDRRSGSFYLQILHFNRYSVAVVAEMSNMGNSYSRYYSLLVTFTRWCHCSWILRSCREPQVIFSLSQFQDVPLNYGLGLGLFVRAGLRWKVNLRFTRTSTRTHSFSSGWLLSRPV
jgi:hypothetical protein